MGKIFAIARIISAKNTMIGLRLADFDGKKVACKDVPIESIKKVLNTGNIKIENVGLLDGEVVGTNGSLERLATITAQGSLVGKAPLIILNKIGNAGYTVVDYKGVVKKARKDDVIAYAKEQGIANGKVVLKDEVEYVSSIVGEYETVEVAPGKYGEAGKQINVNLTFTKDNRALTRHVKADISNEVDNTDVFRSMTPEQKKVIQDFYLWYTVEVYENMSKGGSLKAKPEKVEQMTQLWGEHNWAFAGIKELEFFGAGTCALGHPLRYEYKAVAVDKNGNILDELVFGETCSGDFFDISPENMAKLVKIRMRMSDEIKIMSDITTNHTEKEEWDKLKLLTDIIKKIGSMKDYMNIMARVFGEKTAKTLLNFIAVGMPFPESLVLKAKEQVYKYGIHNFWLELYPEYASAIDTIMNSVESYGLNWAAKTYLTFMAQVKLGCQYGYDPTHYTRDPETGDRKNLRVGKNDSIGRLFLYSEEKPGGFSMKDAELRKQILRRIRIYTRCKDYDLNEVENLLKLMQAYEYGRKVVADYEASVLNTYNRRLSDLLIKADQNDVYYDIAFDMLKSSIPLSFRRNYTSTFRYNKQSLEEITNFVTKVYDKEFKERLEKLIVDLKEEVERNERLARELAERLKREEEERRKKEEEERIKREQEERKRAEQAEQAKNNTDKSDEEYESDLVFKLGQLINKHPEVKETYYTTIAKDIVKRKLRYDDLSYRQKRMVDLALTDYYKADGGDIPEEIVNNKYSLEEKPEIKAQVERILSFKNNRDISTKLMAESQRIFDIAENIKRYNRVSDKQYKHIKIGIELLDKLGV